MADCLRSLVLELARTRVAVDDNVGVVDVVCRVIDVDGQIGCRFALVDRIGMMSTVPSRMMILMAEPGRQTDGDADHEHRSWNAAGDAQNRTQIRRFHDDWFTRRKTNRNRRQQQSVSVLADENGRDTCR